MGGCSVGVHAGALSDPLRPSDDPACWSSNYILACGYSADQQARCDDGDSLPSILRAERVAVVLRADGPHGDRAACAAEHEIDHRQQVGADSYRPDRKRSRKCRSHRGGGCSSRSPPPRSAHTRMDRCSRSRTRRGRARRFRQTRAATRPHIADQWRPRRPGRPPNICGRSSTPPEPTRAARVEDPRSRAEGSGPPRPIGHLQHCHSPPHSPGCRRPHDATRVGVVDIPDRARLPLAAGGQSNPTPCCTSRPEQRSMMSIVRVCRR